MPHLTSKAGKLRVLVVDDVTSMRSLLVSVLKGFGITKICEAENGTSALQELQRRPFDVIFCDWEMPEKSGLQLFEELQQDPAHKDIPFVLITSVAEVDKVKKAIDAGIGSYIVKPFKEATIIDKLNLLFPETTA